MEDLAYFAYISHIFVKIKWYLEMAFCRKKTLEKIPYGTRNLYKIDHLQADLSLSQKKAEDFRFRFPSLV